MRQTQKALEDRQEEVGQLGALAPKEQQGGEFSAWVFFWLVDTSCKDKIFNIRQMPSVHKHVGNW